MWWSDALSMSNNQFVLLLFVVLKCKYIVLRQILLLSSSLLIFGCSALFTFYHLPHTLPSTSLKDGFDVLKRHHDYTALFIHFKLLTYWIITFQSFSKLWRKICSDFAHSLANDISKFYVFDLPKKRRKKKNRKKYYEI